MELIMEKKSTGLSRSQIPHDILRLLLKNNEMRFTELKNKLRISKPVLSEHLQKMLKDNAVEVAQRGREKYYSLNKGTSKTLERKIQDVYDGYTIRLALASPDPTEDPGELLRVMADTMSAIFLLYLLKSIETGKDWVKTVRISDFMLESLEHILAQITEEEEPFDEIDLEQLKDNDELFEKINKMITDKRKMKNVKILLNDLRHVFPGPMEILDAKIKEQGLT